MISSSQALACLTPLDTCGLLKVTYLEDPMKNNVEEFAIRVRINPSNYQLSMPEQSRFLDT